MNRRAQPGIAVRSLNARPARYRRALGQGPASEVACTVGGVVANNSSGMACGTGHVPEPVAKVTTLIAGMAAGADSDDDMKILRHGAAASVIPTRGRRRRSPTLRAGGSPTIKQAYGHAKQGAAHGYPGVEGLKALVGIWSTPSSAPVIFGTRPRKGNASSAPGAGKLTADAAWLALAATTHHLLRAAGAVAGSPCTCQPGGAGEPVTHPCATSSPSPSPDRPLQCPERRAEHVGDHARNYRGGSRLSGSAGSDQGAHRPGREEDGPIDA